MVFVPHIDENKYFMGDLRPIVLVLPKSNLHAHHTKMSRRHQVFRKYSSDLSGWSGLLRGLTLHSTLT